MKRRRRRGRRAADAPDFLAVGNAFVEWLQAVMRGEDVIEAMHEHRCSKDCWHQQRLMR